MFYKLQHFCSVAETECTASLCQLCQQVSQGVCETCNLQKISGQLAQRIIAYTHSQPQPAASAAATSCQPCSGLSVCHSADVSPYQQCWRQTPRATVHLFNLHVIRSVRLFPSCSRLSSTARTCCPACWCSSSACSAVRSWRRLSSSHTLLLYVLYWLVGFCVHKHQHTRSCKWLDWLEARTLVE